MNVDSSGNRTKSPSGRRIPIYKMLKSQFRILKMMIIPNESFDNRSDVKVIISLTAKINIAISVHLVAFDIEVSVARCDHQFDNLAGSNRKFRCVFLYFCPQIHFYYSFSPMNIHSLIRPTCDTF